MGYLHINNLYKDQTILLMKQCYALEKIHGTSAHISWKGEHVGYFAGGESHDKFLKCFDNESLTEQLTSSGLTDVTIYGEAYGGKQQGMKATYGENLKFVAFDVKINDHWLNVENACGFVESLGLEFVSYKLIDCEIESIDGERDADSTQAVRNGVGSGRKREGVVLRPVIELTTNNGDRVISKHKRDDYCERKTPQIVTNADKLKVLTEAKDVADEFVTPMRLTHVLDKLKASGVELGMKNTTKVIEAMIEDVTREAKGEISDTKEVRRAVGKQAAELFKQWVKDSLRGD